jgi:predicted MPP superfamily phosphohydrolase
MVTDMYFLVSFVMCFLMLIYIVRKLKKIRRFTPYLSKRSRFFLTCAVLAALTSMLRFQLLGFLVYLFMFYLFFDLVDFCLKRMNRRWHERYQKLYGQGLVIIILSIAVIALSLVHARQIVLLNYTIDLEKKFAVDSVRIMLVTDLHLGTATNETTLAMIKKTVQEQQPDYLVLGGDIFDESTSDPLLEAAYRTFSELAKELDIIYILGNHEYIRNGEEVIVENMKRAGVEVLLDDVMFMKEGFYFVGRTDKYQSMMSSDKRASLSQIAKEVDFTYPVILLDHQPVELKEAKELGYDVVLSGHTHAGQFFPMSFFAGFLNERLYGLDKEDNFYTIVSSGTGVWGMAIRNASNSEIVILDIK